MPISDIKNPSVNMIPVDPSQRMNQVAALQVWNQIIADYRNGDIVLDEKITTYKQSNDARVLALEEKVRMQPKLVEEGIRTLLQDPGFAQALAGSIGKVPGMDVTIGSVIKAYLEAPHVIEFHEHNDPVTGKLTGATALVQVGEVVSTAIFSAVEVVDPDNANMSVFTLSTENFAGTPATFKVWIGKIDQILAAAANGRPGVTLTTFHREGLSAVVIDLTPKFSISAAATLEDLEAVDIDRDNLIGLDLPAAVQAALTTLLAAIDARNVALAESTAADAAVVVAQQTADATSQAVTAAASAIEPAALAAQEAVNSAQVLLDGANTTLSDAQDGVYVAQQAVQLADNVAVLELSVTDWQGQLNQAVADGAEQPVIDGLQASLDAAIAARDAAVAALAAATNDQTLAETALAAAQADVATATQIKAQADADLAAVMAPLAPLQAAADAAAVDLAAATTLQVAKSEAVVASTTHAQAALVTFNARKVEYGIGADYGLPNYTV